VNGQNFKCLLEETKDNSLCSESGKLFHARGANVNACKEIRYKYEYLKSEYSENLYLSTTLVRVQVRSTTSLILIHFT